ncbi:carnitine O-acetyltransferase-like [Centruroides vittatus]|uniref:carnitine O-acetyltransferase-like n=1 Tax=Centruroides vittatus TaxID=120091 RepID=UPI00351087D6
MTEMKESKRPKPPVPELSVTLNRFLKGIEAIVSGDRYAKARRLVEEYQNSEKMQRLQGFLKKYAESKENYVTGFCMNDMYLKIPLPFPVNSSPSFLLPKQEFTTDDERFRFVAKFIIFSLMFKEKVDTGKLNQEFAGGQGNEEKNNFVSLFFVHFI